MKVKTKTISFISEKPISLEIINKEINNAIEAEQTVLRWGLVDVKGNNYILEIAVVGV